ncbi:MAG: alpha/beta fold hydrolase [Polyangiaceae bacterium]
MPTEEQACVSTDVDTGQVRLRCAVMGPDRGEVVLLLHGFPECGESWRDVGGRLAREGYRVVMPDMRGYGGSEKPRGVESYAVEHLVGDVVGLVEAMGARRAHVVGHDWGGVVAWWTAMLRPEMIDRLAIVNAAHPVAYLAAMHTAAQLRRGWYVYLFQLPWLPEWVLGLRDYEAVRKVFEEDGIGPEEIDPCVASMRQPGARSAALAYYRAAVRGRISGKEPKARPIHLPTLVVWGEKDRFLVPTLAEPPRELVPRARVVRLPEATHWAQIDAAESVARELLAHFRGGRAS